MRKWGLHVIVTFILLLGLQTAQAASQDPVTMLNQTASRLLSALNANRGSLRHNPGLVYSLVRRIVLPNVAMDDMARSVLGRQVWFSITSGQRHTFKSEFATLVIRTYGSAFSVYTNESVRFFPIRGGLRGRSRVQVFSQIIRPDGPPVDVSYRCVLKGNRWYVYDFSVEGVSMIQSFRSQFSSQISQIGFAAMLHNLMQHNQANQ